MNILCIDTTMEQIALALSYNGREQFFIGKEDAKKHNSVLLDDIERLLTENGATLKDIDFFGVVTGPGSFTGIRVGVATINAFANLGKPIVEITSLELSKPKKQWRKKVLVALDCKHDNFYVAVVDKQGEIEYKNMTLEEIESSGMKVYEHKAVNPVEALRLTREKAENGVTVKKAKPFYLKKSSAERFKF